jgi:hypothetical protein
MGRLFAFQRAGRGVRAQAKIHIVGENPRSAMDKAIVLG